MKRIVYIGMDVHSTNFTFCSLEPKLGGEDKVFGCMQSEADVKNVLKYIEGLKKELGGDVEFLCGYEAGCLGFSLYHQLKKQGVECVILAPSTMMASKGKRIKTDARDAKRIAQCLAYGTYRSVHIPSSDDDAVKEYIRMRDDHKIALKKLKQQINALCLRNGRQYTRTKWSLAHLRWLREMDWQEAVLKETLQEYLMTFEQMTNKLEALDRRIEELGQGEKYKERVKKLVCLLGVKTRTALASIVEVGDFCRFEKGSTYAAYLGLTPGESSSGDSVRRGGLSKAGNAHLRTLYIEAAQGICKGRIGHKSKELKARQAGSRQEVIAYADQANERLRRKYYRLTHREKKRNVAVAAIARELACFIWGLMTNHTERRVA